MYTLLTLEKVLDEWYNRIGVDLEQKEDEINIFGAFRTLVKEIAQLRVCDHQKQDDIERLESKISNG